jgi:oxygen-independent coproporphyrinogen-3 oxidase
VRPSPELVRRLDVAGPRYTSYPTVPVWSERFGADEHARALERAAQLNRPLSLYVHIPFCRDLCSYCGCNVIITRDQRRVERYLAALAEEAALVAERLGSRRSLSRVHLGGGTPTFLDEKQLLLLWRALTAPFEVLRGAELAVEINPVVTRPAQIELLAELGFNRLSLGVQDFDTAVQQTINRVQSIAETRQSIERARALGYRSVNLDLIYGLPRQTLASFRRTVAEVVALRPERVALFSFAFVPSVKPHQRRLPLAELPSAPLKLELFQAAHDDLTAAGYRAIGMDHFALPGDELALAVERRALGRDFQGYTSERAPHTVALGMSAISNLGDAYAQNYKSLAAYEAAIESGRLATERGLALDAEDQRRRDVIHALMCNFEVDLGADGARHFARELQALGGLAGDGLVQLDGGRITVTPLGRLFVRNVAMVFDAYLRPGTATFSRAV